MKTSTETIIQEIFRTKKSFNNHSDFSKKPGLYAFILNDQSVLKQFGNAGQVIYVGKTEDSLTKRDFETHYNDKKTGYSTLRRSIGAIKKDEFNARAYTRDGTLKQVAIDHYIFDTVNESKLTLWMKKNLEIGYWEYDKIKEEEILRDIEKRLIIKLSPTLDLDKRTRKNNPLADELTNLRQICKDEAKKNAMGKRIY
jgi:hypothetical protein